MIRTRLTELLGIDHPVMLAGMGGIAYHELVAAVSEAGGFGCLGAAPLDDRGLRREMAGVRERTTKPFGVDLLAPTIEDVSRKVTLMAEGGTSLFVAGLGVPVEAVEACHEHGLLVGVVCGKVAHAVRAADAGCDLVIAQGTEGGGHTGKVGSATLWPQVVDAVGDRVPVVAAGGIYDGRGLAQALVSGCDGVWMGTRFLATPEAHTVPHYKEKVLGATEADTVVTRAYTGKTARALRSAYTDHFEAHPEELEDFPLQAARSITDGANHLGCGPETEVDPDKEFYAAGQTVGGIREVVGAGELVERIVWEATDALRRVGETIVQPEARTP